MLVATSCHRAAGRSSGGEMIDVHNAGTGE